MRAVTMAASVVGLIALATGAEAGTIGFTIGPVDTPGHTPNPTTETLPFAQSSVPLAGASLTLTGSALDFLNFFSLGSPVTSFTNGTVTGGVVTVSLSSSTLVSVPISVPSTSGTIPALNPGSLYNAAAVPNTLSVTVAIPTADLAAFEGGGSVDLTAGFGTGSQTYGAAFNSNNVLFVGADEAASGSVTLTYPPVPEPVSILLLGNRPGGPHDGPSPPRRSPRRMNCLPPGR